VIASDDITVVSIDVMLICTVFETMIVADSYVSLGMDDLIDSVVNFDWVAFDSLGLKEEAVENVFSWVPKYSQYGWRNTKELT